MRGRTWAVAALTAATVASGAAASASAQETATVAVQATPTVSAPAYVVARTPVVAFTVRVRTARRTLAGVYEASVYTQSPYSDYGMGLAGYGTSTTPWVPVTVYADTTWTGWGALPMVACDDATGECEAAQTSLKRPSRVAVTHAEARGRGRVAVAVRATHYDPNRRAWLSSNRSPIRIQQYTARGWVTAATATTNRDGLAGAVITARPGYRQFRAVRLTGATVTSAVSRPLQVRVT